MKRLRIVATALVLALASPAPAAWRGLYVVDARLAALRAAPSLDSPLLKRLRVGRRAFALGSRRDREGRVWLRVAVTRRTRGWILEAATASPGRPEDEARVASLMSACEGIGRAELARAAANHFPRLREAGLAALGEEAAAAAPALSRRAADRLGELEGAPDDVVRALMLSDPGLDRYNRVGITFDVDAASRRFIPRPVRR